MGVQSVALEACAWAVSGSTHGSPDAKKGFGCFGEPHRARAREVNLHYGDLVDSSNLASIMAKADSGGSGGPSFGFREMRMQATKSSQLV